MKIPFRGYKNVVVQAPTKRGLRKKLGKKPSPELFDGAKGIARLLNQLAGDARKQLHALVIALNRIEMAVRYAGYPPDAYEQIYDGAYGEDVKQLKESVDRWFHKVQLMICLGEPRAEGWRLIHMIPPNASNPNLAEMKFDAALIFDAATRGQLGLLRKCDSCGDWFARSRDDHRFCSASCREKWFRSSETGKANRAKFMREYRRRMKRRDSENLRVARDKKR